MKPVILIVDDDQQSRMLLTLRVETDGYEAVCAEDGLDALDKLKERLPDLILLDLIMPRMNGYQLLKALKDDERTRYIPVLMITAMANADDRIKGLELGAEDFISKPYNMFEVSARIKAFLRTRGLQARLRESEKMAVFGEIVDGIAHELRNPLTAIGGLARRLAIGDIPEERTAEYAQRITSSVERMERMVQRISDFKGVFASKRVPGELNAVLKSALEGIKARSGKADVELAVEFALNLPLFDMDAVSLKVAISNILENSLEAIDEAGWIKVRTAFEDGSVVLSISDSGHGMDDEFIEKVFNPFQSSKMTGAGLGLTISSRVVHDHGGTIDIESVVGKGTLFTLLFPVN
ncbi:MAG: response regulator [Proteobacteria bacterium]|nr:response regulator [Pseudomonadota bacterium]